MLPNWKWSFWNSIPIWIWCQRILKLITLFLTNSSWSLQHFSKFETVYAHDPKSETKPGDVVLIKKLSERMTKHITHEIREIVFPFGDVTDPIMGKKVVVGKYRSVQNFFLYGISSYTWSILLSEMKLKKEAKSMERTQKVLIIPKPPREVGKKTKGTLLMKRLTGNIICMIMMSHMQCNYYCFSVN